MKQVDKERMISGEAFDEMERASELSLRPQRLNQYIGQEKIKKDS